MERHVFEKRNNIIGLLRIDLGFDIYLFSMQCRIFLHRIDIVSIAIALSSVCLSVTFTQCKFKLQGKYLATDNNINRKIVAESVADQEFNPGPPGLLKFSC